METMGTGLAALAFWGFIAACVIGGIWDGIRKREARHETLRRLIESGQEIDPEAIDKLLNGNRDLARDLRYSAYIVWSLSPGLAALGWFLSLGSPEAFYPLLGVSVLVAFLGTGLFAASRIVERDDKDRD